MHDCDVATGDGFLSKLRAAAASRARPARAVVHHLGRGLERRRVAAGLPSGGHIVTIVAGATRPAGGRLGYPGRPLLAAADDRGPVRSAAAARRRVRVHARRSRRCSRPARADTAPATLPRDAEGGCSLRDRSWQVLAMLIAAPHGERAVARAVRAERRRRVQERAAGGRAGARNGRQPGAPVRGPEDGSAALRRPAADVREPRVRGADADRRAGPELLSRTPRSASRTRTSRASSTPSRGSRSSATSTTSRTSTATRAPS